MEGPPEGTGPARRARTSVPNRLLVGFLLVLAAAYLIFRLVQGVLWLAGKL